MNNNYYFDTEDHIYISDVNSMYDNVGHLDMHSTFDYSAEVLLPIGAIESSCKTELYWLQNNLISQKKTYTECRHSDYP